jgi:hypothetical protein
MQSGVMVRIPEATPDLNLMEGPDIRAWFEGSPETMTKAWMASPISG